LSWTDERVELLKKLWQDGLSASQIAAELGGVTRNAVIGKVHRLGLSGRAKTQVLAQQRPRKAAAPAAAPAPAARPQRSPGMVRGNTALAPMEVAVFDEAAELVVAVQPQTEVVVPMSRRVSIMELRETMCRWPLGDPVKADFAFCGADCDVSKPYCTHHSLVAFQPSHDRRRTDRRV
jgi:GcrA cell cycle regulator